MLICDLLQINAERNPEKVAVVEGDRRVTYSSLLSMSQSLACTLLRQGFSPGDHAAVVLPRSVEYIVSYFAILLCGGVVVPIGTELKEIEIRSDLQYCDVSVVISAGRWQWKVAQALHCGSLPLLKQVILLDNDEDPGLCSLPQKNKIIVHCHLASSGDELNGLHHQVKRQDNDLALLLHTSGTISSPKRVMLSHSNIIANVRSHIASLNLTSEDISLIALPMHFGYCNTAQMLTHLYLGGQLVLMINRFLPSTFYFLIQQERVTTFTGVPAMLYMLLVKGPPDCCDISSLRYFCFGGSPMSNDKLKQLIDVFPQIDFIQTYGQTEASPRITTLRPEDSRRKLGSIGKPIPGVQIMLINERGELARPGEIGEIVVRGPNIMLGYYKRPRESLDVLRPEGLLTGDLAYADEEGYLYLVGRRKNIIISGGINIYPEEIEEHLLNHPAVSEVMITGEASEVLGEIPVASVVLKPTLSATENDLLRYCAQRLADYKLPRRIEFCEQLPKTYNSKIQRFGQDGDSIG